MKPGTLKLPRLAACLSVLLLGTASAVAQNSDGEDVRYGTIASAGVHVRNLPDPDGVSISTPAKGTIVSIHRERAGWYEVGVPGGYPVWVFGRYLRPVAGQDKVFEVTRNAVNIRPAPKSDVLSFPLPQRLHAGDHVRMIEVLDPQAELSTTWVRIWSPPGVHAWMRATDTKPLAAGEDGAALWTTALASVSGRLAPPYRRPSTTETAEVREAAVNEDVAKAREDLEAVRRLLEAEIEKETPDFGAVRAKLDELLASAPNGETGAQVRHEIGRLALYEEIARVEAELERERNRRAGEARRRQREAWEASVAKDPLGHVFLSRGVLIRETDAGGTPRYWLRFGKDIVSELVCAGGRYDLDVFTGFEVGVQGEPLQSTGAGTDNLVIEVRRLEVTARR